MLSRGSVGGVRVFMVKWHFHTDLLSNEGTLRSDNTCGVSGLMSVFECNSHGINLEALVTQDLFSSWITGEKAIFLSQVTPLVSLVSRDYAHIKYAFH